MKKGHISVETENIFPIIKKFLYSDHEIFLRELVSNAVDATQKLKVLSKNGEYDKEVKDLQVEVDRKSTRLNSSHVRISYAVFCLKKKKKNQTNRHTERHEDHV